MAFWFLSFLFLFWSSISRKVFLVLFGFRSRLGSRFVLFRDDDEITTDF